MSNSSSSAATEFVLHQADPDSYLLEQAIALADANRDHLGILTRAAWRDYAERGGVLVATGSSSDEAQKVLGVASFRQRAERATLAHLAVADEVRGRGLARLLVEEVSSRTKHLPGVLVRCRRDFPANDVWPRLNFVPRGEQLGRGKVRRVITWWWLDHGHADLFAWDGASTSSVPVVVDANVFIDLYGESGASEVLLTREALEEAQESGALLMVTPELPRELDRHADAVERQRLIRRVQTLPMVKVTTEEFEAARELLDAEAATPADRSQDVSDRAHLAHAVAGGVEYLITRDVRAQRRLGPAASSLGVHILSPAQFAAEVASTGARSTYWPAAAHGQSFEVVEDLREALSTLEQFNVTELGEKRSSLSRRLEPLLLAGSHSQAWVLKDVGGRPLAGLAFSREEALCVVHLARVAPGHLEGVLARYIVQFLSVAAAADTSVVVKVVDPHMPPAVQVSLAAEGFERVGDNYVALRLRGIMSTSDAVAAIRALPDATSSPPDAIARLQDAERHGGSPTELLGIEASLAPLTLVEQSIPVWSVPIKPAYAYELLGVGESLLPRKDALGVSVEHVYYTGASALPPAGSRVIWYASGKHTPSYVAQSVVIEAGRLPWKDAYRVHRRLGIYTRDEVQRAAVESGQVGYIRFGRSRKLQRPVSLDRATRAASDLGVKMMLRGPWELPPALARDLMEVAFELRR